MYLSLMSQSSLVSDISMIASKNFLFAAGPAILDLQILNKLVGYIFSYGQNCMGKLFLTSSIFEAKWCILAEHFPPILSVVVFRGPH